MPNLPSIIIIVSAFFGFCISLYIHVTVGRKNRKLVCPIGSTCDPVVTSKYAKTMGVPNTLLGMLYYAVAAVVYLLAILNPFSQLDLLLQLTMLATTGAFIFSIYLIFVQAKILRKWCSWCVASALLTTTIFVSTFL